MEMANDGIRRLVSVRKPERYSDKEYPLEDLQVNGKGCKVSDIKLQQAAVGPSSGGTQTFLVEISDVHVSCGAFTSAKLVNPKEFRRVAIDDCLVNNGQLIQSGKILSFKYVNSFMYPMKVVRANTAC